MRFSGEAPRNAVDALSFSYDQLDRLSSTTDPLGHVTNYSYDAVSRVISAANPAIQTAPLVQFTYTPDGLLGSLTTARSNTVFSTTSYTPDGFDRLSTTTYPDGSTEVLGYDYGGNILSLQTRRGDTIAALSVNSFVATMPGRSSDARQIRYVPEIN